MHPIRILYIEIILSALLSNEYNIVSIHYQTLYIYCILMTLWSYISKNTQEGIYVKIGLH